MNAANSTEFRRVNNLEAEILIYTFGIEVGKFLIAAIRVNYDSNLTSPAKAVRPDKIILMPDYRVNYRNLYWLGIFIHEAAHIWQFNTGLHEEGESEPEDYIYDYQKLLDLSLDKEEHAKAVQDWFNINYGTENCQIGDTPYQRHLLTVSEVWSPLLEALDYDSSNIRFSESVWLRLADLYYACVIEEIRDSSHLLQNRKSSNR